MLRTTTHRRYKGKKTTKQNQHLLDPYLDKKKEDPTNNTMNDTDDETIHKH